MLVGLFCSSLFGQNNGEEKVLPNISINFYQVISQTEKKVKKYSIKVLITDHNGYEKKQQQKTVNRAV